MFILPLKCLQILLDIRILIGIRRKNHPITVFYYGLAGHKYLERCVVGVVDSQLMAVKLECAVKAVVYEHCGFAEGTVDCAVFELF